MWMLRSARAKLILDHPNQRSLHSTPVPRTGGVAIMVGIVTGAAVLLPMWEWALLIAVLLAIVSFLDDRRDLPIAVRFLAHTLASLAFVAIVLPDLSIAAQITVLFVIVWVTNLYNFMDGSDGLAAGMALIGFGAYALAAWGQNAITFALLNATIVGASIAFLVFNFHPAKIFLGDAGSIPLGFLAAALGVTGWTSGVWPLTFPLLVFSPFIIDASVTLAKRLAQGEKIWQAHHDHYYQRLVRMGWGHGRTALVEYVVMIAAAASALLMASQPLAMHWRMFLAWTVFYVPVLALIDYRWSKH